MYMEEISLKHMFSKRLLILGFLHGLLNLNFIWNLKIQKTKREFAFQKYVIGKHTTTTSMLVTVVD